ncbi:hypothetical protein A3K48_02650 [candidate division WOR-1 bacterium RIFOXYA12_FULL_52_29]|uniref:Glycosyl transferase family 1 domain-containing protein n=1 Tax=candidate division WOR-1 bacterium RIFOXYC12_FULL_54_18 TaxID=1802584 RepID=A0A1F4T505_UNCSA|nr:MAG: hypothetical protein A3K44_02650 [candidate division WOR-1 bacterium RIFOXYA2_FULL_51_19]OGC17474.1 MAG: hypothetical protein A3K48_02650 [candidate division WOR-1 bacterium RIFOXYA12_FULL_52_29]OGC26332.1 MAG: hypothetical protein A3K32_02645 [candidate division WOR-1 bacterium RIFOXYB2_FULL_45_9]OGC27891.1 MAG: hypothetical protein A3K49_02650 [candidate division WOR-1 bacterium RIFOXYC12_FULL_54_18]OGC29821.1 MAG: hypothetical protein A2346_03685 [candidate division WOR-1 bacterium R
MKNILFLEQFSSVSGGQKMLLQFIKGLDRTSYGPVVILPSEGELARELKKLGVKYYCSPMGNLSLGRKSIVDLISYFYHSISLIIIAMKVVRAENIDLIYAKAPRTFFWGTIAARLCRKPIVWHLHSIFKGLELSFALLTAKLGVSLMIADSRVAARPFETGDLKTRIKVVHNGIETDCFHSLSDQVSAKADWRLTSGDSLFAYVGRITRLKGLTDYIEAASTVSKRMPKAFFFIVGRVMFGGAEEDAYLESIKTLIQKLGLTEKVKLIGYVEDLNRLYSALDVLVLPSVEPEAGPLVVLEAMAAGKVVIATDNGGQAEVMTNGQTGYLYRAGDREKLAELMISACLDKGKSRLIGERARSEVLRDHSLTKYRESILAVLREVI